MGALGPPLVFWLLLGSGMGESFQAARGVQDGASYLEFFFPGAIVLSVLFSSIFASISLIQDRQQGFLQSVLVAPVPRLAIVVGKVAGGTVLALVPAAAFLALAPLAGIPFSAVGFAAALGWLALVSLGLSGLGFFFAWRIDSVQGYHGVMNLVLMPMWLLSGSVFPAVGTVGWLAPILAANPLTYAVDGLRWSLYLPASARSEFAPMGRSLAVTVAFAALTLLASSWAVSRQRPR